MASIESNYEITVSYKGGFFFRAEGLYIAERARIVEASLKFRFPEKEGFNVSMTYWECKGKSLK